MITDFTPYASLLGGILIGLGAVILMALNGRIAGMTAILSGLLEPRNPENRWRLAFMAGAILSLAAAFAVSVSVNTGNPLLGALSEDHRRRPFDEFVTGAHRQHDGGRGQSRSERAVSAARTHDHGCPGQPSPGSSGL